MELKSGVSATAGDWYRRSLNIFWCLTNDIILFLRQGRVTLYSIGSSRVHFISRTVSFNRITHALVNINRLMYKANYYTKMYKCASTGIYSLAYFSV